MNHFLVNYTSAYNPCGAYGDRDIKMRHSIFRTILKKKKKIPTVLAFVIPSIVGNIFQVVPYQEVNFGTSPI